MPDLIGQLYAPLPDMTAAEFEGQEDALIAAPLAAAQMGAAAGGAVLLGAGLGIAGFFPATYMYSVNPEAVNGFASGFFSGVLGEEDGTFDTSIDGQLGSWGGGYFGSKVGGTQ